jgi:hypothetical protein
MDRLARMGLDRSCGAQLARMGLDRLDRLERYTKCIL